MKHNCNKQKIDTYTSPIETTKRINSTFSILNNTCLNDPARELGNLSADHTQSEITAELSDPELLGAFLKSVNPPLTGNEGWATAVVAKAWYGVPENPAPKKFEHSTGCRTSNTVIKILLDCGLDGDLWFHENGTASDFPYLTRQVPHSWHTLSGSFLTNGRSKVN